MIKSYTQTTYETCLACCLLQATQVNFDNKMELAVINHSLKYSKDDFVAGHLDFIHQKFDKRITRIVDNKYFHNYLKSIKHPNVDIRVEKIDLKTIDKYIATTPIILYIDSYILFKVNHYPHFITVLSKKDDEYQIFDTWDGKIKNLKSVLLSKSIQSLRNHLKFCPQIIIIERKK